MKPLTLVLCLLLPLGAIAQTVSEATEAAVNGHILPGFKTLAQRSAALADTAVADCAPGSEALRDSYGDAFDAWVGVSHLRFGPTEINDRAYALAFWPDARGFTPKVLSQLIADTDPAAQDAARYAEVSIAGRGFYALEYLLYDPAYAGTDAYHCQLIQTITKDIANLSQGIVTDWKNDYAMRLLSPTPDGTYRTPEEAGQELFGALITGLQFTSDTRIGRPLGSFDRPRPNRAEARRSGRSLRHVTLALEAQRELARHLAQGHPEMRAEITAAFDKSLTLAAALDDDPAFAGVDSPQQRLKLEVLQQSIDAIRAAVSSRLGPTLGIAAGFNSMDGD